MLKELWQNKNFRVFCWQLFNASVAFAISFFASDNVGEQAATTIVLVPVINQISKYVNTRRFGDLGVEKKSE